MTAYGLNRAQREMIRGMVVAKYNPDYVRDEIKKMAWKNSDSQHGWDYDANIALCAELTLRGWPQTAKTLESLINNR